MNGGGYRWFWVIAAWSVILFVLAPILIVVASSFTTKEFMSLPTEGVSLRWYWAILDEPRFVDGFLKSMELGVAAAVGATILGTLAAIGLHRKGARGDHPMATVLMTPLMVPSVIIAMAILQFFTLMRITSPYATLFLGHTVITFPYVVRAVAATLSLMDRDIEWAAANLGANPWRVIWHVTIPNVRPGVVGGAILAFMVSFDAVTISIFLQTPDFVPLPVRLYEFVEFGVEPILASLSTLLILFSVLGLYAAERFVGLATIFGART